MVFFGDTSVDVGPYTSDAFGVFEAEFETGDEANEQSLDALLPVDKDVRDITGVQLLQDGVVVLEGDF